MTGTDLERIATLEQEMRDVRDDIRDILVSMRALERMAQTGNGALKSVLFVGAIIGWLVGIVSTVMHLIHGQ